MIRLILILFPLTMFGSDLHDYWFGTDTTNPTERAHIWFQGGLSIDQEISDRFYSRVQDARYGRLSDLSSSPQGRLELIILLDQFSRNIYRGLPEAFLNDSYALSLTLEGIMQQDDLQLEPIERLFFYMPLQHAEDLSIQNLSIKKYEQLLLECDESFKPVAANALYFAKLHQKIIERFGHFPHRNQVLNRKSTEEELMFLQEKNSSF